MRYLKIVLFIALAGLFFVSCSEDDSPTDNGINHTNYFDMTQNSYWIADNYIVNQDGNIEESYYQDSTVITDISESNGLTVYELTSYVEGEMDGRSQIGEDENAVFVYADFLIPSNFPVPTDLIDLPEGWITLYDKNLNNWTLVEDITVEDVPIDSYTADATFNIDAEKDGTETVTIGGESYVADKMILNINIDLAIDIGITVTKSVTVNTNIYMIKGYGIAKIYTEPEEVDLTITKYNINGFLSNTVSMSVSH